jgi:hypothetical protein
MLSRKSTTARKKGGIAAAALILLVCASARITSAVAADSGYALPVAAPLYSYFREARVATPVHSVGGAANGSSAALDASQSDLKARLHYVFGSDAALGTDRTLQAEREVLLRNSDAFVRAKLRVTVVKDWRGFVYADMGATDSALKWQGLAGVRDGHGLELLGGWRHVTYHFSPGMGLDSLDFAGPFLGATLAW